MTSKLELRILTLLRNAELTGDMDSQHLKVMAAIGREVEFEADKIIYQRGDTGHNVYLVEAGKVLVEMDVPNHGLVVMNTVEPGGFFGWSSLFPSERKLAWTRTAEHTYAIAFDAVKLREACTRDHALEYAIVRRAARSTAGRIQANRQQLIDLLKQNTS